MGEQLQKESAARAEQQSRPAAPAPSAAPSSEHPLLSLQRSAGNRAVGQFIKGLPRAGDAEGGAVHADNPTTHDPETFDPAPVGPATKAALENRGDGSPLPARLRAGAERALGADLSRVRLHTDAAAARAAQELEASALTLDRDIYFGDGQFRPQTASGRRLLLHELIHTLQQRPDSGIESGAAAPAYTLSRPGDSSESEARTISARALEGGPPSLPGARVHTRHIMRDYTPARVPLVEPDEDDPGEDVVETAVEDEDEGLLAPAAVGNFPLEVRRLGDESGDKEGGPLVFVVPEGASRKDVARRLFEDGGKERAFDFVPAGELKTAGGKPARAVRVRDLTPLAPAAASAIRNELERELKEDVQWTIQQLKSRRIDDEAEMQLLLRAVKWSQRSDWKDANGVQYFERFLNELEAHSLIDAGIFSNTTKNVLEWLLVELEEKSTYLYELIINRSKHPAISPHTGEKIGPESLTSGGHKVSELAQYDVIGHTLEKKPDAPLAKSKPSIGYITVHEKLLVETTRERAETAARNAAPELPRVVMPGDDGKFYVFSLNFPFFEEKYQEYYQSQNSTKLLNYWWIYPITTFIRGGEFQSDFPKGTSRDRGQRVQLLADAITKATSEDPSPLFALDFDTLSVATLDQRVAIFKLVANSPHASEQHAFDLLTRLLYAAPASEFPQLERRLSSEGVITKLLRLNVGTNILAALGRVFTEKALAGVPMGGEALSNMETFTLGEDEDGWFHYASSGGVTVSSNVVALKDWSATSAPRVGNEPALPGEASGAIDRTGIVFYPAKIKPSFSIPPATKSRTFLPTELVRIRVLGKQQQTLIVTAFEAAGLLDFTTGHFLKHIVSPFGKVYSIAFASMGLVRIFGTALAEGLMAGGLRGGASAIGEAALTKAGSSALFSAALVGSMELVDAYRGELQQTEAGRDFLAMYDVASTILIARDVYHLLSGGIVKPLSKLAAGASQVVGDAGRIVVRRLQQELEALQLAWSRMEEAGELSLVEAQSGLNLRVPKDPTKFTHLLMATRAEVAAGNVVKSLSAAGLETTYAEELFQKLQKAGADNPEVLKAQRLVANRAADFPPAGAEEYLKKIKGIVDLRPRAVGEMSGFLAASAKAADPIAFLGEVEKLVSRKALRGEVLGVLAEKAFSGKLDLAWLNTTTLSDRDLNFLGSDPNTPWGPLKSAVEAITGTPPNYKRLPWVRSILRGAASEMVAASDLRKDLVPGMRVKGSQVKMGDSKIDFELTSQDGLGTRHGLEVKGYNRDTWRESVNAFLGNETTPRTALDEDTRGAVAKIDRMLKQLKDAKAFTQTNPFLAVTEDMTGPTKDKLRRILDKYVPDAEIVYLREDDIKDTAQRFVEGVGVPDAQKMSGTVPTP